MDSSIGYSLASSTSQREWIFHSAYSGRNVTDWSLSVIISLIPLRMADAHWSLTVQRQYLVWYKSPLARFGHMSFCSIRRTNLFLAICFLRL